MHCSSSYIYIVYTYLRQYGIANDDPCYGQTVNIRDSLLVLCLGGCFFPQTMLSSASDSLGECTHFCCILIVLGKVAKQTRERVFCSLRSMVSGPNTSPSIPRINPIIGPV